MLQHVRGLTSGSVLQPPDAAHIDTVTATPQRGGVAIARFGQHDWRLVVCWLVVWNAIVPIRLFGMYSGANRHPASPGSAIGMLILDQTCWALATYVMFRLALRARHTPLRQVLVVLGVLAVPIIVIRHWVWAFSVTRALGWPDPQSARALWFSGPQHLFMLMAAAALGLLVVYMQRERDGAVLQANLHAALASARLQTLRLQLNPHFLFNGLNSIASLVHSDPSKADTAIAALSSFLRASLSVARGEQTTLEDELLLVDAYLEIELLRFDWLTVDLEVPDALRSACVPAFAVQLLVENAIRHGLAPRRTAGRVLIAARRDGDQLELCVSDDGVGFVARSGDTSLGIGLQNVRARLAQLYGANGALTIEPSAAVGTTATIRVPYCVCVDKATPLSNTA